MRGLSRRHFLAAVGAVGAAAGAATATGSAARAAAPFPALTHLRRPVTGGSCRARTASCGQPSRRRPGDLMKLHLRNQTSWPTNLHFHGFHVSPKGDQDNVFLRIEPGRAHRYDVRIPDDHPGGLYRYHPHLHGCVGEEVYSGLAGLLLVEGGRCPSWRCGAPGSRKPSSCPRASASACSSPP